MKKVSLGLLFEQAILFGVLFIFGGTYGIYNTLDSFDGIGDIFIIIICTLFIGLGLIPIVSKRYLCIYEDRDSIEIKSCILFLFNSSKKYKLSDYDIFYFAKSTRNYGAGGGFLPTAKNFSSLKEIDLYIQNDAGNRKIWVKNIGDSKKAERIYSLFLSIENLKPKTF